jgi:FkbM family methyltransferase
LRKSIVSRIVGLLLHLASLVLQDYTYTIRGGLAKGLRRRYGFGGKPHLSLTTEEQFLLGQDLRGKTVFDIGGYIGIYTLFFAQAVGATGRVVTFEPHPANLRELAVNVRLNNFENVTIVPLGVGRQRAQVELIIDPLYPSRGFVVGARKPEHMPARKLGKIPITVVSLDHLAHTGQLPSPDFVKIDVEGLELDVLRGMQQIIAACKPQLLIEVHYEMPELIALLLAQGYSIYVIETWTPITNPDVPRITWGHLFCV